MIQLTIALTRLPSLSRRAFQTHWLDQHGPMVRRLAPALGILEYVQVHMLEGEAAGEPDRATAIIPYDGLAQVWYAGRAQFEAAMASSAGRDAARELAADEKRFIEPRSPRWWGTAHRVI